MRRIVFRQTPKHFRILGDAKADLNQGENFRRQVLCLFRTRDLEKLIQTRKGRKSNECADSHQKRSSSFHYRIVVGDGYATTTDVIFSFEEDEGEYADTDLETDNAGNIYGTTVLGGEFGGGTVFQLSPHLTDGTTAVLYSFTGGADGGEPYKGVTIDRRGNLYGTAVTGGSGGCEGGCGVVYKLTKSGGTWNQTVIHAFTGGDDGSGPGARVTIDRSGNVYGMTPTGGAYGVGTIYKIHPHAGSWDFQVIHTFTGGNDGAQAQPEECFCSRAGSTARLLSAVCMEAELFSSSHRQRWGMGFQGAIFFSWTTRRQFSLWRLTSRWFR